MSRNTEKLKELKKLAEKEQAEKFKKYVTPSGTQIRRNAPAEVKHEAFLLRLSILGNKNVEVLGQYVNTSTKIGLKCRECGNLWESVPGDLLRGHGCPMCGGKLKVSQKEAEKRLKGRNIKILHYGGGAGSKSTFECLIDGYIWETPASEVFRGTGCPKCVSCAPVCEEEFAEELLLRNIMLVTYAGNTSDTSKFRCLVDGYEWRTTANQVRNGSGCPKCVRCAPICEKEFRQELLQRNISIESYGGNTVAKSKFKCNLDGHVWETTGSSLRSGRGCPKCANHIFNILYLLSDSTTGTYKVGITQSKASLPNRIKQISPEGLSLVHFWELSNNAREVEQYLHKELKEYNVYNTRVRSGNTEFFDLGHLGDIVTGIGTLIQTYLQKKLSS